MSTNPAWTPISFTPEVERAYALHRSKQILPLIRLGSVIGAASFAGYQLWDLLLDPDAFSKTAPIRLANIILFAAALGMTFTPPVKNNPRVLLTVMVLIYIGVAIGFALVLAQLPGGFVAGVSGFILGMIFIPVFVYSVWQAIVALLPLVIVPLIIMAFTGGTRFDILNAAAWIGGGAGFAAGFAYLLDIINRHSFHLEKMLEHEMQRSEELLLNILPAEIAARLKAEEEPLADHCDMATVLFADLVGFTELSRNLPAHDLVNLLNDLFSRFDALVEKHGADKIKTIGDAYMVAAGLSNDTADHVTAVANLALDMRRAFGEFRKQHGLDLKLRIGVHSGALVAGVIGKRKFAYDLWGDTVNIASRMESEGVPDEVQISAETRNLLPDSYDVESRGEIEIKGHLPRTTYLLQDSK